MELHDAIARLIGKSTVAPAHYAKLAVPIVAERLNAPTFSVEVSQTSYQWRKINDRFCR